MVSVIFFVHNTHTIDFKIYNIHNFAKTKQGSFFFWLYNHTSEHSLQVHHSWLERGRFFFFFFYKTEQRTRTRRNTHHDDQRNAGIARICYRSLTPARPRQGDEVTNTDGKQLCCYCCSVGTVSILFVIVVPLLFKVLFPPLSLNPSRLPVASSFLSSILRWKKLKKQGPYCYFIPMVKM